MTFRTTTTRGAGLFRNPERARRHHPDFDKLNTQGWRALDAEGKLPEEGWRKEQKWALDMGLPGAESLTDKSIPTFARGRCSLRPSSQALPAHSRLPELRYA